MMSVRCAFLCFILLSVSGSHGASNRRQDSNRGTSVERPGYQPAPSVETLKELAQAMGAAGFEHYTEGSAKPIVKRLIPERSEPDLDEVSYKGIVGKAGVDFPAFPGIPATSFNCRNVATGYYADLETDCQVFHICDSHRKISFLCPNGTIFSQSHLICDWWFKVDCASAPALYETSAEQYSQAQKKKVQINEPLNNRKNSELQQIHTDASNINVKTEERQQLRRPNTNPIINQEPITSSTERQSRYRARQFENITPLSDVKATSRSYQALLANSNFNTPTQRTFETITSRSSGFEKRRKNLVQLIANNFGQARTTVPSYTDAATYRTTAQGGDFNGLKEMQVAAESASFANNNNRQFLQQSYNINNFKPYPVYSPTPNTRANKATTPTYTTAFGQEFQNRNSKNRASTFYSTSQTLSTKRPTLVPYTKVYGNTLNEKHEPYTRPGVYLLKEFLDKEKNKTENQGHQPTERSDKPSQVSFESATKIPISRSEDILFTAAASSDRYDVFSNQDHNFNQISTEPTYYNRRERLTKKLNIQSTAPEPTTNTEKYFGRRPGLIVPPSLTPKTLHSLAIYYATALDNLSTTTESEENQTSTFFPEQNGGDSDEELPSLLSQHTIDKYSNLFSQNGDNSDLLEEIKLDGNGTNNDLNDDLSVQQSQGPLSSSPQIRELAQVFTHALSAYLQDPVQFRKVLSDIRPTQPTFGDVMTTPSTFTDEFTSDDAGSTTFNEEEDEILGFSDDNISRRLPSLAQLRDAKIQTTTPVVTLRSGKAFNEASTTPSPDNLISSTLSTEYTTTKSPFRCCGSISASYTSASTEKESSSTPLPTTNGISLEVNGLTLGLTDSNSTTASADIYTATTENSYTVPKYGGFQNNTSSFAPYGKGVQPTDAKPLNREEYSEATNLPAQWGNDGNTESYDFTSTSKPITNPPHNIFDVNNLIKDSASSTTYLPTTTENNGSQYVTESESIELENEEELQRAHSQSFVSPTNNIRQGKHIEVTNNKNVVANNIRKPSADLELPSSTGLYETSTTIQPSVTPYFSPTTKYLSDEEIFSTVSPLADGISTNLDADKINQNFANQWSNNNYDSWHSTVILDPITLNDGLSAPKEFDQNTAGEYAFTTRQVTLSDQSFASTTTPPTVNNRYNLNTNGLDQNIFNQNSEQYSVSSSQKLRPTSASLTQDVDANFSKNPTTRGGRLLKNPRGIETSTETTTNIDNNMVEIAKEIIGGLNATTTDKLMNVMMKTKSKTVRRLILLLVQTCDDDHNKTAEASKKALLDALMAVSQKELDVTTTEAFTEVPTTTTTIRDFDSSRLTNTHRRMDRISEVSPHHESIRTRQSQRTGKSIRVDPNAINALTNSPTVPPTDATTFRAPTEAATSQATVSTTEASSTPPGKYVASGRRGVRKFLVRTSPVEPKVTSTTTGRPVAEARVLSSSSDLKPSSDTRALELLRSLYTIAARWG